MHYEELVFSKRILVSASYMMDKIVLSDKIAAAAEQVIYIIQIKI